jgi:hypothetical protein
MSISAGRLTTAGEIGAAELSGTYLSLPGRTAGW